MYMFMFESFSSKVLATLLALVLSYHGCRVFSRSKRAHRRLLAVPHTKERVLIIGASSGVGAEIARLYAFERGARVGIVGRNEGQLRQVFQELASSVEGEILWDSDLDTLMHAGENEGTRIKKTGSVRRKGDPWAQHFAIVADCSDAGDVARLQETVHAYWDGPDTVIITAGVSSVLPFMELAKPVISGSPSSTLLTDAVTPVFQGLQRATDVTRRALDGNLMAPLLSAAAMIPLVEASSPSPSILLLSSVASVIPAPTRALYSATKSASLLLFQSLSIEHPRISFSSILPASIEGNFRAGAVDTLPGSPDPKVVGPTVTKVGKLLTRKQVAKRCIEAVDCGDKTVWMPGWYRIAHLLYWVVPGYIERGARRKYNIQ